VSNLAILDSALRLRSFDRKYGPVLADALDGIAAFANGLAVRIGVLESATSSTTTRPEVYEATFSATFTPVFSDGQVQIIILTGNIAIDPPSDTGGLIEFILVQDATGGRTVTWDSDYFGTDLNDIITVADTYSHFRFAQRSDAKLAQIGRKTTGIPWAA
jgi:hypothetical protein